MLITFTVVIKSLSHEEMNQRKAAKQVQMGEGENTFSLAHIVESTHLCMQVSYALPSRLISLAKEQAVLLGCCILAPLLLMKCIVPGTQDS